MWDPNKQNGVDWLKAQADPECWDSVRPLVDDPGVALSVVVASDSSAPQGLTVWGSGPRLRLRPLVRTIYGIRHDERLAWLIGWLEGRWPRGKLRVGLPLLRDDAHRSMLHVQAPMPPPRMLLSQGPLPLPRPSVEHFRAFHRITGTQHLASGGIAIAHDQVQALVVRWQIEPSALRACLAAWPVSVPGDFPEPDQAVHVEACYTPEPHPSVRVTMPRSGGRRLVWTLDGSGGEPLHQWIPMRRAVRRGDGS